MISIKTKQQTVIMTGYDIHFIDIIIYLKTIFINLFLNKIYVNSLRLRELLNNNKMFVISKKKFHINKKINK